MGPALLGRRVSNSPSYPISDAGGGVLGCRPV